MNTKVIITAEDQTAAGINSVKTSMAGLGATIGVFTSLAQNAISAMTELVTQTVGLYKSQIDIADSMDKMSLRMAMSIKDLGAWKAAAEMSGASTESLLAGTRMLAKHMTEHGAALRRAGIDTKDTNKAFDQLADLVKGMSDPVARLDLVTRLFGRGMGQQLLPMLVQGSAAMREIREATDPYGEALTKLAPEAQKLNDTLYLMGVNFKQAAAEGVFPLVKTFNDELLPALREVAKEGSLLKFLWAGFGGAMKIGFADPWNQTLLGAKATLQQFMADVETMLAKITFGKVSELHLREAQRMSDAAKKTLAEAAGGVPKPLVAAPGLALPGANTDAEAAALAASLRNNKVGGKAASSEIDRLTQSIREKVAVTQAEIDGNAKLTEGEKLAVKTMVDLRDGKLKGTAAEKMKLAAELESLLANEARLAQMKTERENMEARTKAMGKMVEQDAKVADLIAKTSEANREHIEGLKFELSILGLSEEAKKRAQALRQIDIKLAKDLLAVNKELANRVDSDGMNPDLGARQAELRANADEAKRTTGEVFDQTEARARDWTAGMSDALTAYLAEVGNSAKSAASLTSTALKSVEDAWVKYATTGKISIRDLAQTFIAETARMLYRQNVAPAAASFVSGAAGFIGKALGLGGGAGMPEQLSGPGMPNAKGNVFASADLHRFAGTIVSSPTLFKFAQGGAFRTGLMGEAGAEAIMPLKRGSSGRLGVEVTGGGGGVVNNVSVVVNAEGSRVQGDSQQAGEMGRRIESAVRGVLLAEKRPGGLLGVA